MQQRAVVTGATRFIPRTIGESIEINAEGSPQAPAIVFSDGAVLTYGGLFRQIQQIGSDLRRYNVGARDRVAIVASDASDLAILVTSICCHATALPLNPQLTTVEIENLFDRTKIDAIVVMEGACLSAQKLAMRCGATILVANRAEHELRLTLRGKARDRSTEDIAIGPDSVAVILRTSGTSGRPKLVAHTHRNRLAMANRLQRWFNLVPSDRALCIAPLYYAQGLQTALYLPLLTGGSIACPSSSSKFDFFKLLDEFKPTYYAAGPTLHRAVIEGGRTRLKDGFSHSLRFIISGGAPLPEAVHDGLRSLFDIPIIETYGISEVGLVAANLPPFEQRELGAVGKFERGELALEGEDGSIIEIGGPGEIVLRGSSVTPGYIDDAEANTAAFTDGWFRTGDLGRIDADGVLTICGRIKELINRGGEKVSPAQIDRALLRHPAVAEAVAFPVPHVSLGEDVNAAVVLHPDCTVTPLELRQFLQTELTPFALPRKIHIVDHLKKGETGKASRQELSRAFGTRSVESRNWYWNSALEIQIADIWQQLLDRECIGPEDDFFELGGDSLLATRMLLELERLTGRVLPETMLFESASIRQLAENVILKDAAENQDLLVRLQHGNGDTPFVFVDGDFSGGGYYVRNLARHLGSGCPIYSLRSHSLRGDAIPSIEQMARTYKQILEAAGICGPVNLGGYCHGALIALELARQIEAGGQKVEFVAMVDSFSFNVRPQMRFAARVLKTVIRFFVRDPHARQAKIYISMSRLWKLEELPLWQRPFSLLRCAAGKAGKYLFQRRFASAKPDNVRAPGTVAEKKRQDFAEREDYLMKVYHQRMATYIPGPVMSRLAFFVSEESLQRKEFSAEVWRRHYPHCEIAVLPGSHLTCITTHVKVLADRLRESLTVQNPLNGQFSVKRLAKLSAPVNGGLERVRKRELQKDSPACPKLGLR